MLFTHTLPGLLKLEKQNGVLMQLFWSAVLRQFAVSFLIFFSGIYIFKTANISGYSVKVSLLWVMLFYLLTFLSKQIFLAVSENVSQKTGFKGIVRLSLLPYFLSITFFVMGFNNIFVLLVASIFWGIHAALYWWGYHGYFAKTEDKIHFGFGIGEQEFLKTTATITAPILGALIVDSFGFKSLFLVSLIFMTLSVIVVGKKDDKKQRHDIRFKEVTSLLWNHPTVSLAYVGQGAESIFYSVAWPLFLFILYDKVIDLGAIVSISLFISAIVGIFIGSYIDRQGERGIVGIGTPILSISWLIRLLGRTFPLFVLADSFRNFGDRMVQLPLLELTYKKASEGYVSKAILFRELALGIGVIVALIIFSILLYLDFEISQTFFVPLVFSLFPLISVVKRKI